MTTKKTATVTEATVHAALRRGSARALAPVEERVLRMRLGAGLPARGEIAWTGTASEELAIELRALEIETYLRLRAHQSRQAAQASRAARTAPRAGATGRKGTKEKIVRALRRRGPSR